MFASNHPLGGLDGICLSSVVGDKFNGKIKYLVNDILYYIDPLKPIFVPINKYGAQAKTSANAINEAYASDNQVITFPAGLCSRKTGGVIMDLEWTKSFIIKAVEFQRDVMPVHFEEEFTSSFTIWRTCARHQASSSISSWSTSPMRCTRTVTKRSPSPLANPYPGNFRQN